MKAAVLTEPERIELCEIDAAVPEADEALVQVRRVGICGTDVKILTGQIPVSYPRVMGHEVVGEVVAAPDPELRGARVLVDPAVVCGTCRQCHEGRTNICTGGWLLGRDRDGGLQETMAVPMTNVHRLPDAVGDDAGPLLQVLATCIHGQQLAPIVPGESVAVLGLGVTGLLHLQLAVLAGARPITCVTRSEEKLALARALGADVTIRADGSEVRQVYEAAAGGVDLAIDCVGSVATFARAVDMLRVGGRLLSYGTITATTGDVLFYDFYFKELAIFCPRSARSSDFPLAINAVASGGVRLDPLLSHRFSFSSVQEALATAAGGQALKVIVEW